MRRTAQLKSFLPWAGIILLCCLLAVWVPLLFGCKSLASTGSCSDRGYPYWCSEYGSGYYSHSSWDCIYN